MMTLHYWGPSIPARLFRTLLGIAGRRPALPGLLALCLLSALLPAAGRAQNLETLARAYRNNPTPANHAALNRFAEAHTKDASGAMALLVLGATDVDHGRQSDAVAHLSAARSRLPRLADYIDVSVAQAQYDLQNFEHAARASSQIAAFEPRSPLASRGVMILARASLKAGNPAQAVQALRENADWLPQPAGDLLLANALDASGDPGAAAAVYQKVWCNHPTSDEARQAEAALARLKSSMGSAYPPLMPSAVLERARKLINAGEYRQARRELDALIPQVGGADRDLARVLTGEAEYQAKENLRAYDTLKSLQVGEGEADAERLYYLVSAARRLDREADISDALGRLARQYPNSPWRMKALVSAGDRLLLANRADDYEPIYQACAESFAGQPDAAYCHWKVAWSAYVRRRGKASQLLRDHVSVFPASEKAGAAMYYLGRIAERDSDPQAARAWYAEIVTHYPNYYYAMLARERLEEDKVRAASPAPAVAAFLQGVQFPPRARKPVFEPDATTNARLERSRLLASLGLEEWAELELRFGAKHEDQPHLLALELARMYSRRGSPDQAIRTIKTLAPGYLFVPLDAAPADFWRLAFPIPYRTDIERCAKQHSLDPYLVAALIRQESEFNPKAVSRAKARGLTQVEPSTGRALSRGAGAGRYSTAALLQPSYNLKLGTYYLKRLLDELGGKWEETLASYNAGKNRVVNWRHWSDFREPAEFVETIPFTETRNYVQFVLRNADLYRRLYTGQALAAATDDPPAPAMKKSVSSKKTTSSTTTKKKRVRRRRT